MTKHIIKEGNLYHVTYWDSYGSHCSNPTCEINLSSLKEQLRKLVPRKTQSTDWNMCREYILYNISHCEDILGLNVLDVSVKKRRKK